MAVKEVNAMPAVLESPRVMAQKSESVLGSINRMSALPFVGDDPEDQHTVNNWRGDWDKWDNWDQWDQNR